MNLDELLEEVSVMETNSMDDEIKKEWSLDGWYAVADSGGIIAYFAREKDAYRFRLNYINSLLNPAALSDSGG